MFSLHKTAIVSLSLFILTVLIHPAVGQVFRAALPVGDGPFQRELYPGGPSVPIDADIPIPIMFQRQQYPGGPWVPGPPVPNTRPTAGAVERAWRDMYRNRFVPPPGYYANEAQAREEARQVEERSRSRYVQNPESVLSPSEFLPHTGSAEAGKFAAVDPRQIRMFVETMTPGGLWKDINYSVPTAAMLEHHSSATNTTRSSSSSPPPNTAPVAAVDTTAMRIIAARSAATWQALTHLKRLFLMARELKNPESSFHNAPILKEKCLMGLHFWLQSDFTHPNLFVDTVETENILIPVLVLLQNDMPADDITRATDRLTRSSDRVIEASEGAPIVGETLLWLVNNTKTCGILLHDPQRIGQATLWLSNGVAMEQTGDDDKHRPGIQKDFSFQGASTSVETTTGGQKFLNEAAAHAKEVSGTAFAMPQDKVQILSDMLLQGNRWMVYGTTNDPTMTGRLAPTPGMNNAAALKTAAADLSDVVTDTTQKEDLKKVASDDPTAGLIGNKMFWHSDYMAHRRPNYFSSVRMASDRMERIPLDSGAAWQEFFLAGGANPIVQSGEEYRDIFPLWSWAKIPGGTVPQIPAAELLKAKESVEESPNRYHSFVGGVSDGMYGFIANDYDRGCHAKKSIFFFDNEIVSLGAGITATTERGVSSGGYPIVTTVNQCRLVGDVFSALADGTGGKDTLYQLQQGSHSLDDTRWVWHNGIGYVFTRPTSTVLFNDKAEGNWFSVNDKLPATTITDNLFVLCVPHGSTPQNATYSYIAVVGQPASEMPNYVKDHPVKIVANRPTMQGVYHTQLNIGCAIFYTSGEMTLQESWVVSVDKPCLVMFRGDSDTQADKPMLDVWVSDPTQKLDKVTLTVSGNWQGEGVQPQRRRNETEVIVVLPQDDDGGSSQLVQLR